MRKVTGIGETVYDIIFRHDQPTAAQPGGSTFNAMISLGRALHRHGTPIAMVTETGDDHIGRLVTAFMERNHVATTHVTVRPGSQTHLSLAFLDEHDDAHYSFYKDHAHAALSPERASTVGFAPDDVLLYGSYFAINPVLRAQTRPLLSAAREAGAISYYDINFRQAHVGELPHLMPHIVDNLGLSTVVRGSTDDFAYLYGTRDPQLIYDRYVGPRCPLMLCTDGGGPVTLCTPDGTRRFAARPVATVSTIGAGDNFNAGFIYGLIRRGVTHGDLSRGLPPELWDALIASAQAFASRVCQSVDNYIDEAFAQSL